MGSQPLLNHHPHKLKATGCVHSLHLPPLTEDGIHEQDLSPVDIRGKLGIVHLGFLRLLVALDQNLPDANGPAAVS